MTAPANDLDHRTRPDEAAKRSYHATRARHGEAWDHMTEQEKYEYTWGRGFAYCWTTTSKMAPFVEQFVGMLAYLVDRMEHGDDGDALERVQEASGK